MTVSSVADGAPAAALEARLVLLEQRLADLNAALCAPRADAVEQAAAGLQEALAGAVDHFQRAARQGGVPPPLRRRLALASGEVAAQREALARATAALDRAIDLLLPARPSVALYSSGGASERSLSQGGFVT
ncbi:MAG: hypothetical protein AMXMBFR66_11580 [Pseudomonadota bacterium]|nr:hypothetical protein [Rubrivivax sp.]